MVVGLDYVKFKIYHSKKATKTKTERNPHLSIKTEFIFCAGHHPTQYTTVEKQRYEETRELPTGVLSGTPSNALSLTAPHIWQPPPPPQYFAKKQNVGSRGNK